MTGRRAALTNGREIAGVRTLPDCRSVERQSHFAQSVRRRPSIELLQHLPNMNSTGVVSRQRDRCTCN